MSFICLKCEREFSTKSGCTQHSTNCNLLVNDCSRIIEKYLKGMSICEIMQEMKLSKTEVVYALKDTKKRTLSERQKCSHTNPKRKKVTNFKVSFEQIKCECGKIFNAGNFTKHKKVCFKYVLKNNPDIVSDIINKWKLGIEKNELKKLYGKQIIQIVLKNKRKKVVFSEQIRQNISKSRLKYFNEHPEKLPYRLYHSSKKSYVEELFKKALIDNNIEGWEPRYRIGIYEYDIAFVKEKIDVEIDGKTHELDIVKKKDEKRDEWSKHNGWSVLRFSASEVKHNISNCLFVLKQYLEFAGSSNWQDVRLIT